MPLFSFLYVFNFCSHLILNIYIFYVMFGVSVELLITVLVWWDCHSEFNERRSKKFKKWSYLKQQQLTISPGLMLEQRFRSGRIVPLGQMVVKDMCSSFVSPRTSSSISERSSWKTDYVYCEPYENTMGSKPADWSGFSFKKAKKKSKTKLTKIKSDFPFVQSRWSGISRAVRWIILFTLHWPDLTPHI